MICIHALVFIVLNFSFVKQQISHKISSTLNLQVWEFLKYVLKQSIFWEHLLVVTYQQETFDFCFHRHQNQKSRKHKRFSFLILILKDVYPARWWFQLLLHHPFYTLFSPQSITYRHWPLTLLKQPFENLNEIIFKDQLLHHLKDHKKVRSQNFHWLTLLLPTLGVGAS